MSLNENIRCTCIIDPANRQVGLDEWLSRDSYAAIALGAKSAFTTLLAFIFFEKFNKLFSLKCNPDDKLHPVETVTSPYLIFNVLI